MRLLVHFAQLWGIYFEAGYPWPIETSTGRVPQGYQSHLCACWSTSLGSLSVGGFNSNSGADSGLIIGLILDVDYFKQSEFVWGPEQLSVEQVACKIINPFPPTDASRGQLILK
jgi:hypothetical protein